MEERSKTLLFWERLKVANPEWVKILRNTVFLTFFQLMPHSLSLAVDLSFLVFTQVSILHSLLVSFNLSLTPKCISLSLLHFSLTHWVVSVPYLKIWALERIRLFFFFQRFTLPVHVINACMHLHAPDRDILEMQSSYVLFRYCIELQYSQSISHLQVWKV